MVLKNILLAYGSRYGCTEEISYYLAQILRDNIIEVDLLNLRQLNNYGSIPVNKYNGIIIGSGIRIGKWTKETKDFLQFFKDYINDSGKILGVFVSCGYAADSKKYPYAINYFIVKKLKNIGIKADLFDAFGGVFDYSKNSKKNFYNRKILTWVARDIDIQINYSKKNDFRNWFQIKNFAEKFINVLNSSTNTVLSTCNE